MLFKKLRIIFLGLLFFSLFISCENAISYDEDDIPDSLTAEEVNTSGPEKYASISGYYQNNEGALPAGIQKAIAKIESAGSSFKNRSAYPGLNTTLNEIQYYVTATAENEKAVSGSVSVENKSYSVTGLKFGIDWTVEVGIKVKQTGESETENWIRCFYDVSEPVRITESNMAISRNLILKPDTSGYGSVELNLTTDSIVTSLEIKLDDAEQNAKWQAALAADEEKEISVSKIKLANLPAGQYDLTLLFKRSGESYPCYSTTQTIVVIKGMTTDTWQSNGTSLISATGEFSLTSALISNYVDSCIYVGPNSAASSIGVSANNSNEGRAYSPLASVNEAIKRIRNANVSRDYKIFVSGSREENIKIGGEGADVLPGTAASSITIQGLNNNNAEDVLTAPQLSTAPCLSIQTDIPVILKNIKITTTQNTFDGTYSSSEKGGGLYIETSSSAPGVTLDSGVLIDGCIISGTGAKGAGIYLDSGKLTIKTGAKISNNHFPNSNGFGGGIYIKSGAELILSGSFDIPYGGSVTQNDIYVEAAESIKIKNAISPQAGTSGAMATITPAATLGRNASIVSLASGSSLSSITPYKDYFALSNNDWIIKANSAGNALIIDAPIYVAGGESTRKVCTAAGSVTGNGTKSAPFDNIEHAVNAIIALNAAEDYTIYIDGEIIGLQSIPASFTSDNASSLTIQGASGNTNDILNANREGGSVLTISSTVPVTIKDLKITGGENDEGAGITVAGAGAGAYLVLGQGSLITENNSSAIGGGGVSIAGGTLIMMGNAEISKNSGRQGGGIHAKELENSSIQTIVRLKDNASIKDCEGADFGGICLVGSSVSLYVQDNVEISGNKSLIGSGGGIGIYGSTANISGGLIKENKAVSAGGAVSVQNDGVLNLSGSVWIPEGVTDSNGILHKGVTLNDIYLEGSCKVKIAGALTPPAAANGKVAAITPGNKVRGLALIEADNTNVTDLTSYKDYFALTQAGWNLNLSADKKTLSLDSPIYVAGRSTKYICTAFGSDEDSADGTSTAPFATIKKAIELINSMNDSNQNYTIVIDGEILSTFIDSNPAGQDIGGEIRALSLTIKGANGLDDNGNPKDIINGRVEGENRNARAITINTSVPITLECLMITGGLADDGGAISLDGFNGSVGSLTLSNDILITENKANATGGGLYIYAGSTLNVIGNVVIEGNTNTANPALPSNLYLQDGQKITVAGALTNGDKKARIYVNTQTSPATSAVEITNGYGYSSGYNANVSPENYFHSDSYAVILNSSGEACLKAGGGSIVVDDFYEDIEFSLNKSNVNNTGSDTQRTITVTAKQNGSALTVGSGTNQISYTFSLTYHGETVPSNYYETNSSLSSLALNQIRLGSNLPSGDYVLYATASYKGKTYNASFSVSAIEKSIYTTSEAISEIAGMTGENTIKIIDSNIDGVANAIKNRYTSDHTLKVNLDLSEVPVTSIELRIPNGIKSIVLPETLTSFSHYGIQYSYGYDIEAYSISESNTNFSTEDGVLYNKAKTKLIMYPRNKQNEEFTLPATVTELAEGAFLHSKVKRINGLPQIQKMASMALEYTDELVEADLSGLTDTTLESYMFANGAKLQKVTLSSSISKIMINSFKNCSQLKELHFKRTTPPALDDRYSDKEFDNCNNLKFYVPAGSKNAYLATSTNSDGFANTLRNYLASRSNFSDLIIEE